MLFVRNLTVRDRNISCNTHYKGMKNSCNINQSNVNYAITLSLLNSRSRSEGRGMAGSSCVFLKRPYNAELRAYASEPARLHQIPVLPLTSCITLGVTSLCLNFLIYKICIRRTIDYSQGVCED